MDNTNFDRVKLEFRKEVKAVKLDRRVDMSLSSMENLRKLICKNFQAIQEIADDSRASGTAEMPLIVKCLDSAGDFVTIETDKDLEVAREDLQKTCELKFKIDLTPGRSIKAAAPGAEVVGRSRSEGVYQSSTVRTYAAAALASASDHNGRPGSTETCRHFARGHCRDGPTCRFSHEHVREENFPASSSSRRGSGGRGSGFTIWESKHDDPVKKPLFGDIRVVDYWLTNQHSLSAGENIEQLSGEKGVPALAEIVERKNLPSETIVLFVQLLVKDEIRTSLLRQKTNKIYGVLLGSPFLLQLHAHIASHLGNPTRPPKAQDVRSYLLLTEELQSRTADGWKEVPLDALRSVVLRLKENAVKDELVALTNRLVDQREKLQRLLAITSPDKCLQGAKFREQSIVPSKDELLRFQARQDLPVNRIGTQYGRVSDYLETQFQLLREDCIEPLRQGIKAYSRSKSYINGQPPAFEASTHAELRIYTNVQLCAVRCGDQGVEYILSFHLPPKENDVHYWESSKKLMFGALLCISPDHFQTFFWGVVSKRDVKDLAKGLVAVRIMGESDPNVTRELERGHTSTATYVMVESTAAYFEAYYHVLKTLQREEMEDIPFTKYLLSLEPSVNPPSYLLRRKRGDEYDFSSVFPDMERKLGRTSFRITQSDWPSGWADSFDRAQLDALKQGLTKELAIIQGPPGTGKTFLGLTIVKLLLANLERHPSHDLRGPSRRRSELDVLANEESTSDISGPILVICYTNHALDQFLEGIHRSGMTDLIRIGGQSKSDILRERNLRLLLQRQRADGEVEGTHRRFFGSGRKEKDLFEDEIHKCIDDLGTKLVTREMLHEIATPQQVESLFSMHLLRDESSTEIVKVWLSEPSCVDPRLAHHFFVNQNLDQVDESKTRSVRALFAPARHRNEPGSERKLRGQMKPLPKSPETDRDGWREVIGRRRRRQAPRNRPAEAEDNPGNFGQINGGRFDIGDVEVGDEVAEVLPFVEDNPGNFGHNGGRFDIGDNEFGDEGAAELGVPPEVIDERGIAELEDRMIDEPEYALQDFVDAPNVWELNVEQRWKLHEYWLEEIRMNQRRKLKDLTREYENACKNIIEVENEIQLALLRKAKVVGMTTTAAAKHHDVLKSLKPEIIIVEEAAEVLEGHILACISPSVQHLILIGDHLQLRPSVSVYRLSTEHKLDVSMFERLVKSGVEHITLQEQRRMRPSISKLMKTLYPRARDHESVTHYEAIKGVRSNVFFFDHKAGEDNVRDAASKLNSTEAKLVVEFCFYLLNQGCYKPENIAILSMYTGQLVEIKALLKKRMSVSKWRTRAIGEASQNQEEEDKDIPRVSSVDDFQGEESDIIILSLVRSNSIVTDDGVGKIGFLKIPNRICVALTRAKKGLFIFGNAALLAEKSPLWKEVTNTMREDGGLGPQLELYCQNHTDIITMISSADDFKQVEDGGCSLPCEFQLECGHACPRRCHPGSHENVVCPKPCLRKYDACLHKCTRRCHGLEDCPPCDVIVTKEMPGCGHQQTMQCSTDVKDEVCYTSCPQSLQCGHKCTKLCGRPCTELCPEKVVKVLPSCGHSATMSCHKDAASYLCNEPCGALLQECEHHCQGSCGQCKNGTAHIPCLEKCGRTLLCGHLCKSGCSLNCPPCERKCQKRCFHSRCSELCGKVCTPCREPCSWKCEHHKCEKSCHEVCTRPKCDLPCPERIPKCGHPCIGLCGEPCPKKCRVCHPDTLDIITQMTLGEYEESDRFVALTDCNHIFEVSGLDTWMESNGAADHPSAATAIKLKECPECKTPIWRTHRYSSVVKKVHSQVEDVKKRIYGYETTRQGNDLLEKGDNVGALSAFRKALQQNPGLMEAHFGAGRAFCAAREYAKAITHLSFIVERSSFSSALTNISESARGIVEKFYRSSSSRAADSIAIQAIVQLAGAMTNIKDFTGAVRLCDAVLARGPENGLVKEIKEKASRGETQLVMRTAAVELGLGRGHWYTCPNGHYYCIGECGQAMEFSRCPDCHAQVGGEHHTLRGDNRRAAIG